MEAACNLSPEKSDSTQNYAQARTNVVMETVRAATMATSKKLERLAVLQEQYKKKKMASKSAEQALNLLVEKRPSVTKRTDKESFSNEAIAVSNSSSISESSVATSNSQFLPKVASSPMMSHKKTKSYHDEFKKYKSPFMAPEKLQIVKPLEGRVVILSCIVYICDCLSENPSSSHLPVFQETLILKFN